MKRILSIDGGGIRGIIPALVLKEVEQKTGKPTCQLFDLIAGTSTGGIIALVLSKGNGDQRPQYEARELVDMYEKHGDEIFSRTLWKGLTSIDGLVDEKYSHEGIEELLKSYLGDVPLGSALTRILITSYDIQNRQPYFFKSWRDEWQSVEMRHIARATSAAPTFFEPALVPVDGGMRALIDGGIFINNPAVSAYAEARRLFPDDDEFLVVSLGTGELNRPIPYEKAKDWGKADWMLPAMSCVFDGVTDAVNYQLTQILGERFIRLQTSLSSASDDMDDISSENLENLKHEANKLITTYQKTIDEICTMLV